MALRSARQPLTASSMGQDRSWPCASGSNRSWAKSPSEKKLSLERRLWFRDQRYFGEVTHAHSLGHYPTRLDPPMMHRIVRASEISRFCRAGSNRAGSHSTRPTRRIQSSLIPPGENIPKLRIYMLKILALRRKYGSLVDLKLSRMMPQAKGYRYL